MTTPPLPTAAARQRLHLLSWMPLALLVPLLAAGPPARAAEVVVGDGKAGSDVRGVGEFNSLAVSGGLSLKVRQGSPASVVVRGDSNLLPWVETVVEGDRSLQLRLKRGASVRTTLDLVVEVIAPQVHAVSGAGSGDIQIDTMKVPRLALSIKGSGDLRAKALDTDDLTVGIAGSGDLQLAGRAPRLTIEVSGSGNIDAGDLRGEDVTVGIAGSGNATVHATRKLVASIAGSGDVRYSGEPSIQRSIAGSGSVRRR